MMAHSASATVSSTLVADTYIVSVDQGAAVRHYAVLDVYIKGNHLGDSVGAISGLSNHPLVIATSEATGISRHADTGKYVSGAITGDIFAHCDAWPWSSNCWRANEPECAAWDSFITYGARTRCASIVNRCGSDRSICLPETWTGFITPSPGESVPCHYIPVGGHWQMSWGSSPYGFPSCTSENPWARVSLYNSAWASTYPTLDRSRLLSRGTLVNGAATAATAWQNRVDPSTISGGTSLDFHWMLGRFAIEVTGRDPGSTITLNVQFNMVGKNGSGSNNETGTTFTGATTAAYRVSQFFAFAIPARVPCPADLDGDRGVNSADIAMLLQEFGPCVGCQSDLDADGSVDTGDISLLLLEFGTCPE